MTTPAHAELIHAFADGKTLQWLSPVSGWNTWKEEFCPNFDGEVWRAKPEPKVTRYLAFIFQEGTLQWAMEGSKQANDWGRNIYGKRIPALDKEVTEEE